VEAAIGSDRGTITLATAGDSGSVTALDWARDGRVEVPIVMLDDVAADLATITLVKIDVEGWEAHVLSGGTDALSRTKNVLIEINPQALRKAGVSPEKIFDLLRRAGFAKFVTVTENGFRKLCRSSVTNILATR
jgi:hypothetical protein